MQHLELIKSPEVIGALECFGSVACHGRLAHHGRSAYTQLNPGGAKFLGVVISVPELWARDPDGEFVPSALDFQIGLRSGLFARHSDGDWRLSRCLPVSGLADGRSLNLRSFVFQCPQVEWLTVQLLRVTSPDGSSHRRRLALHKVSRLRSVNSGTVSDLLLGAQVAADVEGQDA